MKHKEENYLPKICFKLTDYNNLNQKINLRIKWNDFYQTSQLLYKNSFEVNLFTTKCIRSKNPSSMSRYDLILQERESESILDLSEDHVLDFNLNSNLLHNYVLEVGLFNLLELQFC